MSSLQQKLHVLLEERRSSGAARNKLEALCRDLQAHYSTLRVRAGSPSAESIQNQPRDCSRFIIRSGL